MFDDYKIKYLEMIQSVISRMASNSFKLKGWTITLTTGILALTFNSKNSDLIFSSFLPVIAFWLLDSYYLLMERKYRNLYNKTLEMNPNDITFKLNALNFDKNNNKVYWRCMMSKSEFLFYIPILLLLIVTTIILKR